MGIAYGMDPDSTVNVFHESGLTLRVKPRVIVEAYARIIAKIDPTLAKFKPALAIAITKLAERRKSAQPGHIQRSVAPIDLVMTDEKWVDCAASLVAACDPERYVFDAEFKGALEAEEFQRTHAPGGFDPPAGNGGDAPPEGA